MMAEVRERTEEEIKKLVDNAIKYASPSIRDLVLVLNWERLRARSRAESAEARVKELDDEWRSKYLRLAKRHIKLRPEARRLRSENAALQEELENIRTGAKQWLDDKTFLLTEWQDFCEMVIDVGPYRVSTAAQKGK